MEQQKILNLWNDENDPKFVIRKWNFVNHNLKTNYDVAHEITYNTEVLESNLCDYNDAYILVKGDITATVAPATQVSLENCAPFTKRILIKLSNYSETIGSLWFYSKNEATNFNGDIESTNHFKFFKYKAKLLGNTVPDGANGILKNATIAEALNI